MFDIKTLLGKLLGFQASDVSRRPARRSGLQVEALEERCVPAAIGGGGGGLSSVVSGLLHGWDQDSSGDSFIGNLSGTLSGSTLTSSFLGNFSNDGSNPNIADGDPATGTMSGSVSDGSFSGTFSFVDSNTGFDLTGTASGTLSGTTLSGAISGTDPLGNAINGTFNVDVMTLAPVVPVMTYDVTPNQPLQVTNAGQGLLSIAYDPQGDPLTVTSFTQPANGSVTVNPDGTFQYNPLPGYTGLDSFSYTVSDGTLTTTASATVIVGTSIWTDGTGDGQWSTAGNWLGGVAPTALDNVVFDGNYSNADCVFTGAGVSPGSNMCNSITITNNYEGTLHLQQAFPAQIGPGGINQGSGDIEQDSGQDIDDGGNYNWTGGDLNANSAFLANINLSNGAAFNVSTNQDETTGDNINLTGGSNGVISLPGHKITFNKNAGISIAQNSTLNLVDGNLLTDGTGVIVNQGSLLKTAGTKPFQTWLPIENSSLFQLQQGGLLVNQFITTPGAGAGDAFVQYTASASTTDLYNNTTLLLDKGNYEMFFGHFYTEGAMASISVSPTNWVWFNGGYINLNHGNQLATGTFVVGGGGKLYLDATWYCKVNCAASSGPVKYESDLIIADYVTIGGGTFDAYAINVPPGGVPANQTWGFLFAIAKGNQINGSFDEMILDFNDGSGKSWTPDFGNNNSIYLLLS
jgi:hypothetical protein